MAWRDLLPGGSLPGEGVAFDVEEHQSEADWLAAREGGLGGTDVAAVLGKSPFKSAFSLWHEKAGTAEATFPETEAMRWGKLLEDDIADDYANLTGRQLLDLGRHTILRSRSHPFLFVTLDRVIVGWGPNDLHSGTGMLEIKALGAFGLRSWKEEQPEHQVIQVAAAHHVTGWGMGSLVALFGGRHPEWIDLPRSERFIAAMVRRCEAFWHSIADGNPPTADASESTSRTLSYLHPDDDGSEIELLGETAIAMARQLTESRKAKTDAEKAEKEAKNWLAAAITGATFARLDDGTRLSAKTTEREGYAVAPMKYRTIRRMK